MGAEVPGEGFAGASSWSSGEWQVPRHRQRLERRAGLWGALEGLLILLCLLDASGKIWAFGS